jgi:hypothetical protein
VSGGVAFRGAPLPDITIIDSTFTKCSAFGDGGGAINTEGFLTITTSKFDSNSGTFTTHAHAMLHKNVLKSDDQER